MTNQIVLSLNRQLAQLGSPASRKLTHLLGSNSIRLFTREQDVSLTRTFLEKRPHFPNTYTIGCDGSHNLDIAALRKPSFVVIVERDPRMIHFWNAMIHSLEKVDSRDSFVNAMQRHIHRNLKMQTCHYYPMDPRQDFAEELNRPGSWLSSAESFKIVQDLAKKGRIAVITGKFYDQPLMVAIAKILRTHGLHPDTIYVGEFPNRIFGLNRHADLWDLLCHLAPDERTALIFSQHVHKGKQEVLLGDALQKDAPALAFAYHWNTTVAAYLL